MKFLLGALFIVSLLPAQTFQSVIQKLEQTPVEQRRPIIERYLNSKGFSPIVEQDSMVHFVLYGAAQTVSVNGDLQHWNEPVPLIKIPCGPYSLFYRTFIVPPDARLDYLLNIDGREKTDPQNPNITPSGFGPHSELRMPHFVSSPYLIFRPDVPRGSIDSLAPFMNFPPPLRRHVPSVRPVKVYRPAGYDTLSGLPVLYVHDGFEAIDYTRLPVIMDNLIAERKIRPLIAVFIPPVERGQEYIGGTKDRFVRYLADELVPMIDHLYRTDPSPQQRAMTGISAGAYLSFYSIMKRPDVFGNAGGQSSPVNEDLTSLTDERLTAGLIPPHVKIYVDCGRFDIVAADPEYGTIDILTMSRKYSDLLISHRVPHYYKEVNDGHEWASWRERLPEMLIYFFGKQQ